MMLLGNRIPVKWSAVIELPLYCMHIAGVRVANVYQTARLIY